MGLAIVKTVVDSNNMAESLLAWSRSFRCNELTVEEIQDRFASLNVSGSDLPADLRKLLLESQMELDSIRWGMCTAGQRGEIARIFTEIEALIAHNRPR